MRIRRKRTLIHDTYSRSMERAADRARDISARENNYYAPEQRLDYSQAAALYQQNSVARNAVDNIVNWIFKNGISLSLSEDAINRDISEAVMKVFNGKNLQDRLKDAMRDGLISGHALLFILQRSADPKKPMDFSLLKGQDLIFTKVDGRYLTTQPDLDILSPTYNRPVAYFANGIQLHPSKCVIFNGIEPPDFLRPQYKYMGMSYYEGAYQAIINDDTVSRAIPNLVYRNSIVNYRIKGFKTAIKNGTEDEVIRYVQVAEDQKSFLNATITDMEDEIAVVNRAFGELHELDERSIYRLSAAFKQPATILLGKSPDGLNATGEKDLFTFYDYIQEWQEKWRGNFEWIIKCIMGNLYGKVFDFELSFGDVSRTTPDKKAEMQRSVLDNVEKMQGMSLPQSVIERYLLDNKIMEESELEELRQLRQELDMEEENESGIEGFEEEKSASEDLPRDVGHDKISRDSIL